MRQTSLTTQSFNCITDYALETVNAVNLDKFKIYFDELPIDPYLEGNYRFRRLSNFQVDADSLIKLRHSCFFQSKSNNPLLGDVIREYEELDDEIIAMRGLQKILMEFFDFCQTCSISNEVAIHQIRTTTSSQQNGNPAPEGIHRDGVDLVGIFCVNRHNITGGETHLYKDKNAAPVFSKILNPGELLVFNDRQFFHYTSPIQVVSDGIGTRDVFVLTCPGLNPKKHKLIKALK